MTIFHAWGPLQRLRGHVIRIQVLGNWHGLMPVAASWAHPISLFGDVPIQFLTSKVDGGSWLRLTQQHHPLNNGAGDSVVSQNNRKNRARLYYTPFLA